MHELTDEELELSDIAEIDKYDGLEKCDRSYEQNLLLLADAQTQRLFKGSNFTRKEQVLFLKKQHDEIKVERKRISKEMKEKFGIDLNW